MRFVSEIHLRSCHLADVCDAAGFFSGKIATTYMCSRHTPRATHYFEILKLWDFIFEIGHGENSVSS